VVGGEGGKIPSWNPGNPSRGREEKKNIKKCGDKTQRKKPDFTEKGIISESIARISSTVTPYR